MVPFKYLRRLLSQTNSVLSYPFKHWIIFQFFSFYGIELALRSLNSWHIEYLKLF